MKPSVQQNIFNQPSQPSQPQGHYSQQKFHHPSPQKQPAAAAVAMLSPHSNQVQLGGANHRDLHASAHRQPAVDHQITGQGLFAANLPTGSPRNQPTFAPSLTPQDLTPPRNKQPMYENIPYSQSPAPDYSNRPAAVTVIRSTFDSPTQSGFSRQANQPSVLQLKEQFQQAEEPPPSQPTVVNGYSAKTKDYFDGSVVSNMTAKTSVPGSGSGVSSVARQQPVFQSGGQPSSSASPRLQRPLKPSDMSEFFLIHNKKVQIASRCTWTCT